MTKKTSPLLASVKKIVVALDDKKAIHIQVLDMRNLVTYTDFIIVCSGTSAPHMNALMEHVEEALAVDMKPVYRNSSKDKNWLILDYVDVVVHIFDETTRRYYDLETLWGDAEKMDLRKII